jgi:MoxR-like ATPase
MPAIDIRSMAEAVKDNVSRVIVGKDDVIELLLVALISSGHVLLEDVPGTGKTLLAKAIAKSIDCSYKRVQFTPDLLPSDLTGIYFYNQKRGDFEFRQGPVFSNILLTDEINRATPRTQSSLLECMEERQVSIDGETHVLPRPFLVMATQNPVEHQGTFPLPEAQLDRFLLKIKMGYPSTDEGVEILKRFKEENPLDQIEPVVKASEIVEAQRQYSQTYVSDDILRYMVDIVEKTRGHDDIVLGVSPRGSQSLLKASQALAILKGRDYVVPDDVKSLIVPVLAHRIILKASLRTKAEASSQVLENIINKIAVPSEDRVVRA